MVPFSSISFTSLSSTILHAIRHFACFEYFNTAFLFNGECFVPDEGAAYFCLSDIASHLFSVSAITTIASKTTDKIFLFIWEFAADENFKNHYFHPVKIKSIYKSTSPASRNVKKGEVKNLHVK